MHILDAVHASSQTCSHTETMPSTPKIFKEEDFDHAATSNGGWELLGGKLLEGMSILPDNSMFPIQRLTSTTKFVAGMNIFLRRDSNGFRVVATEMTKNETQSAKAMRYTMSWKCVEQERKMKFIGCWQGRDRQENCFWSVILEKDIMLAWGRWKFPTL